MLENSVAFLVTHSILWIKGKENANYNLRFLVTLVLFLPTQEKNISNRRVKPGMMCIIPGNLFRFLRIFVTEQHPKAHR